MNRLFCISLLSGIFLMGTACISYSQTTQDSKRNYKDIPQLNLDDIPIERPTAKNKDAIRKQQMEAAIAKLEERKSTRNPQAPRENNILIVSKNFEHLHGKFSNPQINYTEPNRVTRTLPARRKTKAERQEARAIKRAEVLNRLRNNMKRQ